MKDDDLLRALAQRARQEDDAAGPVSPEERALLEPLSGEAQRRIEERIGALVGAPPAPPALAPQARPQPPPSVLERLRRWWVAPLPVLAAAAAALLLWPKAETPLPSPADGLPVFQAELQGGRALERGHGDDVAFRWVPGDAFDLVLRPERGVVGGDLAVRAFLLEAAGPLALPLPAPEVSPSGSLRLRGSTASWPDVEPGSRVLWLLVARAGDLEGIDVARPPPSVRQLRLRVERAAEGAP